MQFSLDLPADLHAKLARLAAQEGRDAQALARDAIERMVDYDEWFLREVDEGLAAADREEFVDHHEIRRRIDDRYPGRYCASSGPGPPPTTLFKFAIAFKQTTELAQRVVWLWASLSALNRYSGFHCAAVLVGRPVRASWLVPGLPYMAIYRVRRDRIEIAAFCTVRKNGPERLPLAAIVAGMMELCE